jgi:hypothetical protein
MQASPRRARRREGPKERAWEVRLETPWIWLALVLLVPLLFHAPMIFQGKEPPAPDTQAVRPLGTWALAAQDSLGTLPLWCPAIFSGMPSYGSFIYTPAASHHLFDTLVRPFRDQRGMRYALVLLLAGASLFLLARRWGAGAPEAAAAALLFVLAPYLMGVMGAGHSTKLRALGHVPLLWLALELFLEAPGWRRAAFLGLAVALLGWTRHPQIAYETLLLAFLYGAGRLLWSRPAGWGRREWARLAVLLVVAGLLALGMLADPMASVREYAPYSVRGTPGVFAQEEDVSGGTPWDYATAWSFHPKELVSFLVPEWFGLEGATYWGPMPFTQSTHYFGVVAVALALLGCFLSERRRWVGLWAALSLVVLLIGFGRHVPILYKPMYLYLPFFKTFRVPSMIYAFLPLTVAPLVLEGLRAVREGRFRRSAPPAGRSRKGSQAAGPAWTTVALALAWAFLLLWWLAGRGMTASLQGSGAFTRPDDGMRYGHQVVGWLIRQRMELFQSGVARSLLLLALLATFLELRRRRLLAPRAALALVVLLLVADVWIVSKKFQRLEPREKVEEGTRPDAALEYLAAQPGPFRFLDLDQPSSNVHAALGLQSLLGYHAAKLRAYQDLVDAGGLQSPAVLDMLQTRYLVSSRDEAPPGYHLVRDGPRKVFERDVPLPRAWGARRVEVLEGARQVLERMTRASDLHEVAYVVQGAGLEPGERAEAEILSLSWGLHRIAARVRVPSGQRPGLVVFSEMAYPPGWRALVDGRPVALHTVNHVLRAVEVPAGEHTVVLEAVPGALSWSLPLSRWTTVAVLLFLLGTAGWRRRRAAPGAPRG